MNAQPVTHVLNELLGILSRSLPAYLSEAHPWTPGQDAFRTALGHLVADQQRYAGLLCQAIVEHGGRPDPASFPMSFMAKNDLALEFLRREVLEHQERDVAAIEQCVVEVQDIPSLRSLAQEILGNARGHLEILGEAVKAESL